MDLGDVKFVRGDGARRRGRRRGRVFYVSAYRESRQSCQRTRLSRPYGTGGVVSCIPFDEVFKMFLDENAELVLDPGNVQCVCWASVWDLVIFKALIALVVTCRTKAL